MRWRIQRNVASIMDSETIEWLAEKLDWLDYGKYMYGELIDGDLHAYAVAEPNFAWHLTPAGAWEVVTKMGWWLLTLDDGWVVERKPEYATVGLPVFNDPIRAVELAVIAEGDR